MRRNVAMGLLLAAILGVGTQADQGSVAAEEEERKRRERERVTREEGFKPGELIDLGFPTRLPRLLILDETREVHDLTFLTMELGREEVMRRVGDMRPPIMVVEAPPMSAAVAEVMARHEKDRGMRYMVDSAERAAMEREAFLPQSWFDQMAAASLVPVQSYVAPPRQGNPGVPGRKVPRGTSMDVWGKTDPTLSLKERRKQQAKFQKANRRGGRR